MSSSSPLISIITVCLNCSEFIEMAIQSVLSQTYSHIEYIIIDGGSTDGTVEMIHKYESCLAYWHSQPDHGIAQAFNLGLAKAQGDWIAYLNADDFYLGSTVIEQMVPHLILHKDANVVFGNMVSLTREKNPKPVPLCKLGGHPWCWQEFRRVNMIPHQAAFTRRHFFEQVGCFDETFRIAMDYDLFLRAKDGLRAQFVPIPIVGMREGGLGVKRVLNTLQELKRAQIKNQSLPKLIAQINFLWLLGRLYSGKIGHRALDPFAGIIHWPGRN